jgi:hypothetical protein
LSFTVTVPLYWVVLLGENVTVMVQLASAARLAGQLLVSPKLFDAVMLVMLTVAELWLFVNVTVCPALVPPAATSPKFRLVGEIVTGTTPVPLKFEDCGLFDALSLTTKVAEYELFAAGVNVTLNVQLACAARDVPHVVVFANSAAPLPEMFTLVMVSVVDRLFIRVRTWGALVRPTASSPKLTLLGVRATGKRPVPDSDTLC